MPQESAAWRPKKMYCPNCRHLILGFEDKNGMTRITCENCRATMVRKSMGRRHDRIDIYAPREEERIYN